VTLTKISIIYWNGNHWQAEKKKWDAFATDPEWLEKRAVTEADGQIVASVNNQILMPTKFSSVK